MKREVLPLTLELSPCKIPGFGEGMWAGVWGGLLGEVGRGPAALGLRQVYLGRGGGFIGAW